MYTILSTFFGFFCDDFDIRKIRANPRKTLYFTGVFQSKHPWALTNFQKIHNFTTTLFLFIVKFLTIFNKPSFAKVRLTNSSHKSAILLQDFKQIHGPTIHLLYM